jgi:hypothetical protein
MNKDMAIKNHVLQLLKQHMLGEEGKKFHPKAISVEMIGKPKPMDEEHMANGGLVYDDPPHGWGNDQDEHLGSDVDQELAMEARGGPDFETHTPGWENAGDKTLKPPMKQMTDGYPNTPGGWGKGLGKEFADGGYANGGYMRGMNTEDRRDFETAPHGPKMKGKDFGATDSANTYDNANKGYNKDHRDMLGGQFETEDLEHVEDGDDFNHGHPKRKMNLKEFLRSKS